jgi:hypothetical protein
MLDPCPRTSNLSMRRFGHFSPPLWSGLLLEFCAQKISCVDEIVMEPATFGRASFLDWMVSGYAMDRLVHSLSYVVAVVIVVVLDVS